MQNRSLFGLQKQHVLSGVLKIKKRFFVISLLFILLLAACSDRVSKEKYDLDGIVATLNGKEITKREIIEQYPITEENIEVYLKEEVVIDDAKNSGINVSKAHIEELKEMWYPNAEVVKMEDFHVKEAKALGLTNDEYFDLWALTYLQRNEYIQTYIKTNFDEPSATDGIDDWGKEVESHIEELYKNYIENQKLIIF